MARLYYVRILSHDEIFICHMYAELMMRRKLLYTVLYTVLCHLKHGKPIVEEEECDCASGPILEDGDCDRCQTRSGGRGVLRGSFINCLYFIYCCDYLRWWHGARG